MSKEFSDCIQPKQFWELLKVKLDSWWKIDAEKKTENFNVIPQRTCLILPLLIDLGRENNYHIETEAFPHIDIGYYSEYTSKEWAKWSFEIAIEHENSAYPSWCNECSKLMGINAGLKVLISYYSETFEKLSEELNEFPPIYQSRKFHQLEDNYLFVFIPLECFDETDKYSVFEYSNNKLQPIQKGK